MPSKKKKTPPVEETEKLITTLPEREAPKVVEGVNLEETFYKAAQVDLPSCGHVNRQFWNSKGELEDLICHLPLGHEGDHWSKFISVKTDYGQDEMHRSIVTGTHEVEKDGYWSDGAGVPAVPHVTTREEDFKRLQDTRTRERGTDEVLSKELDNEIRKSFGG